MPKGQRLIPDQEKLVAIAYDIESGKIRLEDHQGLLWPRFLRTFRPTTSNWKQKRGHTIYKTALSKGHYFFILFVFYTSERTCTEKPVAEFLATVKEHDKSYQFNLNRSTIIAFRNWAALEEGEVPGFVEFTDTLLDPDITLVKRMLSQRGLQETDSWTNVMSILFPDYPTFTKLHAAFDERHLAHGQGRGVTELDVEGRHIMKFWIPRLSIGAGATYGEQEAMGAVGEEGTVPNEATESEHNHVGGFPNYPESTEDRTALPNRISFDAPINTMINFAYGGWVVDWEHGEPHPT